MLPTTGFAQPVFEQALPGIWSNGRYGVALDLLDDRLLVGATGFSDTNIEQGAVHTLIRSTDLIDPWTDSPVAGGTNGQFVGNTNTLTNLDYLGRAIDIDGSLLSGFTAIIGAPGSDTPPLIQDNTGAAYILTDTAGQWRVIHRLDPWDIDSDEPTPANDFFTQAGVDPTGGQFGRSVAVKGNLIAVGIPYASAVPGTGMEPLPEAGAVAVYHRTGNNWELEAVLSRADTDTCPNDIHQLDYFGYAVALSGNFLAVGAPMADDPRMSDTGACWLSPACLGVMSESDCGNIGGAIWLPGQSCTNTVDPTGAVNGACCHLDAALCQWQTISTNAIDCTNTFAGVWIQGQDVGGVECPIVDNTVLGDNLGAVHVFERTLSQGWQHRVTLQPFATNVFHERYRLPESWFGLSVAFQGSTIAVGQPGYERPNDAEPEQAGGRGMAWAFDMADSADTTWSIVWPLDPNTWLPPFGPVRPAPDGARYGWSVDVTPCHIAVGAPGGDYNMDWEPGGAYIWHHEAAGQWSTSATLDFIHPNSADPGEQWGFDVAIVDEGIAIGGWLDDGAGQWSGATETWTIGCACDPPTGPNDDLDQDGCSDTWQIVIDPGLDIAGTCGDLGSDGLPQPDGVLDLCQMGYCPGSFLLDSGRGYQVVVSPGETLADALSDPMLLIDGVELAALSTYFEAVEVAIVSEWNINLDGPLWLGGRQTDTSGNDDAGWTWPFDEIWSYTNWTAGQPGNKAGKEDALLASAMGLPWEWSDELVTATTTGHVLEYASDCNGNMVLDAWDIRAALVFYSDDIDCDADCRIDSCQIADGSRLDCNGNGIPDRCDVFNGTVPDCNGNGVPDQCEVDDFTSDDCNGNGIPDECDDPDDLLICDAIVINEVMVEPEDDVNGDGVFHPGEDQYVEIVNNTSDPIDLNGWEILQDSFLWHQFSTVSMIDAHCAVLVFGGGSPNLDTFPANIPLHTASNGPFLALLVPDEGHTVTLSLRDNDDLTFDNVTWGEEADTPQGESLARCPDIIGNPFLVVHSSCDEDPDNPPDSAADRSPGLQVDLLAFACDGDESDSDDDGVPDGSDNCPNIWNPTQADCDENGIGDACDLNIDCDINGTNDPCQIALDPALDCDEDGSLDICQIVANPDLDCNSTARLDSCEIADGAAPDCNGNGLPDSCDIANGTSLDENGDGIPDECCLADVPCDGINGLLLIVNDLGCVGTPPTCPGDFNCSGLVDTGDILDYLSQCSFK